MKYTHILLLIAGASLVFLLADNAICAKRLFVDPVSGNDRNKGTSEAQAWKSFFPLEKIALEPGDQVLIKPGKFDSSLCIEGAGSNESPIKVSFAPGRYDFFPDQMQERQLHISNTNDAPKEPKKLAIVLNRVKNVVLEGKDSDIYCRGKMIEVFIENSENIKLTGLNFDYHRPTVSEFKVLSRSENNAVIEIHKDSTYKIEDGKLIWLGEGWSFPLGVGGGFQKRDVKRGQTFRFRSIIADYTARQLDARRVELNGKNKLNEGEIVQNRQYRRDCVGVFQNLSKGIIWENCNLHFLHGMGVISQFTENIAFRNVRIAPREGSGRTCAAWADMLHFSGCRGSIVIDKVFFSGANDDAINVHGTYLAIHEKLSARQLLMQFRHKQTYGFQPFFEGDEVGFVESESLTTYANNKVTAVERKNDREWMVTLAKSVPTVMKVNDVLENVSWTPNLTVTNSTVEHIPTRGFLISTRGKVEVRNNQFIRTPMPAILIAGDCKSWFESGAVTDVLIEGNTFTQCKPISIHPENRKVDPKAPVHRNIRLVNNTFNQGGPWLTILRAKSTQGLEIRGNLIKLSRKPKNAAENNLVNQTACSGVAITVNKIEAAD